MEIIGITNEIETGISGKSKQYDRHIWTVVILEPITPLLLETTNYSVIMQLSLWIILVILEPITPLLLETTN